MGLQVQKSMSCEDIHRFRTHHHWYTTERVSCVLKIWSSGRSVKKCSPHDYWDTRIEASHLNIHFLEVPNPKGRMHHPTTTFVVLFNFHNLRGFLRQKNPGGLSLSFKRKHHIFNVMSFLPSCLKRSLWQCGWCILIVNQYILNTPSPRLSSFEVCLLQRHGTKS